MVFGFDSASSDLLRRWRSLLVCAVSVAVLVSGCETAQPVRENQPAAPARPIGQQALNVIDPRTYTGGRSVDEAAQVARKKIEEIDIATFNALLVEAYETLDLLKRKIEASPTEKMLHDLDEKISEMDVASANRLLHKQEEVANQLTHTLTSLNEKIQGLNVQQLNELAIQQSTQLSSTLQDTSLELHGLIRDVRAMMANLDQSKIGNTISGIELTTTQLQHASDKVSPTLDTLTHTIWLANILLILAILMGIAWFGRMLFRKKR